DVARVVADPVVRQTGTLVGSLCHNDPAGDWPSAALAARADVVVRGKAGTRTVPIDKFLVDSFTTAVAEGELALEARFPVPDDRTAGSYQKVERKVGDFATAGGAVQISLNADGTILTGGNALTASGPRAVRAEDRARVVSVPQAAAGLVRGAADAAAKKSAPQADLRGSVDYKRNLAGVLVARGLRHVFDRLGVNV